MRRDYLNVRKACTYILDHCSSHQIFPCEKHNADALKFAIKMVENIYCNNKQKIKESFLIFGLLFKFFAYCLFLLFKKPERSKHT